MKRRSPLLAVIVCVILAPFIHIVVISLASLDALRLDIYGFVGFGLFVALSFSWLVSIILSAGLFIRSQRKNFFTRLLSSFVLPGVVLSTLASLFVLATSSHSLGLTDGVKIVLSAALTGFLVGIIYGWLSGSSHDRPWHKLENHLG